MANSVTTKPDRDEFRDRNAELFAIRDDYKRKLAELLAREASAAVDGPSAETAVLRRRIRRLEQALDDTTYEIVQSNMGLVRRVVMPFAAKASSHNASDFEAAGVVGLMRAIESFDPEKGTFGAWAYKLIQREVLSTVRAAEFSTLTQTDFESRPGIPAALNRLQRGDHRATPSYEDIAEEAGVPVGQVQRVLEPTQVDSLHGSVAGDDRDIEIGELIPSPDASQEGIVLTATTLARIAKHALPVLDERELMVLTRRMGLDGGPPQNLEAIGRSIGRSREAVRQIEDKAIAKLQHPTVLRKIMRDGRD